MGYLHEGGGEWGIYMRWGECGIYMRWDRMG